MAATRMACVANGVGDQEDRYLKALGTATRYELRGEKLVIYFDGSDGPLAFSRAAGRQHLIVKRQLCMMAGVIGFSPNGGHA